MFPLPASSDTVTRVLLPTIAGSMCWYDSAALAVAAACKPPLCVKALTPTYGWYGNGRRFAISDTWFATVVSVGSSFGSIASIPIFKFKLPMTLIRLALPVRSPYPLMQPCTCAAPARTASIVDATAVSVSLCA